MASTDDEYEEVEVEVEEDEVIEEVEVEEDDPVEEEEDPEEDEEDPEEEIDEVREEKLEVVDNVDGDEEEYEEIEVEEDVEVTDNDEAEQIMEDQSAIEASASLLASAVAVSGNPMSEARLSVELQGDEICSRSGCTDTVMSEATDPCDIHDVEAVGSAYGRVSPDQKYRNEKTVLSTEVGVSKTPKLINLVADPPVFESGSVKDREGLATSPTEQQPHAHHAIAVVSVEKSGSSPVGTEQLSKISTSDDKKLPDQKASLHLKSTRDMEEYQSRYDTSQARLRSISPRAECVVKNKRPAIVCEYYAKGWCIKGSSCRFLHKRDLVESARGHEGDMLCFQPDKGSADVTSRITHNQLNPTMTYSNGHMHNERAGRYSAMEHGKGVIEDELDILEREFSYPSVSGSQRLPSYEVGSGIISSQEAETNIIRDGSLSDQFHHASPRSVGGSNDNFFPKRRSFSRRMCLPSGSRLSCSSSSYTILEESAAMQRHYGEALHFIPFRGIRANSSSEYEHHVLISSLKDQLLSYKCKDKIVPYKWEPSVPFHSFFLSSLTSSSDVKYDPLIDSIEQPDVGHESLKRYTYGLTPGRQYQDNQSISGRNSVESRKKSDFEFFYNYFCGRNKDVRAAEAESAAICATDAENRSSTPGEEHPATVKDVLKVTRTVTDGNRELKHKDSKVEKGRHLSKLDEEESKIIKFFRAALVEFVKELMRPVWHEGRLSKDVYKAIVQKAEDKILRTLPSNEVPSTPESIKQYLSSSRPKILKLIQAYLDKYGKF